jgi:myosin-crossreactive antigen
MDYEERLEYLEDIFALIEINNVVPVKIFECAKNRIEIRRIKKELELLTDKRDIEKLRSKLNEHLNAEIKLQKKLKKSFVRRIFEKICG